MRFWLEPDTSYHSIQEGDRLPGTGETAVWTPMCWAPLREKAGTRQGISHGEREGDEEEEDDEEWRKKLVRQIERSKVVFPTPLSPMIAILASVESGEIKGELDIWTGLLGAPDKEPDETWRRGAGFLFLSDE